VFRSTQRLWQKIRPFCQLQTPTDLHRDDERILRVYREMHRQYFLDRDRIPAGHLCEVRYEDLERRPLETLERVYTELSLPDFDKLRPRLVQYLDRTAGYQKNRHQPLPAALLRRINTEWAEVFDRWGYTRETPDDSDLEHVTAPGQPAAA
jgi:hypothetical protein